MTKRPVKVFVDFDGTIAVEDTTDLLLARFAGAGWRDIERAWERGEIGSRECMVRQIDLLRATPDVFDGFIDGIRLDPDFASFVALCRQKGVDVTVVSDGLDRSVHRALRRLELSIPVKANSLEWLGDDRWKLTFPHAREDCRSFAGHCKCQSISARPYISALIGDGRSDYCAAAPADAVFAKARLADHCRESGIPHIAFSDFGDLLTQFPAWLEGVRESVPRRTGVSADAYHAE